MKKLIVVIPILLCLFSCHKVDVPAGTPACIEKKIKSIAKEPVRNPPAQVFKCQYNGETVYYIPPYCCDAFGELYDEDCNLICYPDGGFSGAGDERCTDFHSTKTSVELIWQDER